MNYHRSPTFMGYEETIRIRRAYCDEEEFHAIDGTLNAGDAPAGRSQKNHNLIQAMNQGQNKPHKKGIR